VGVQLKRERFNLHDRNAIRVIGVTRDGAQHALGYIPKEISKRIAKANLFDSIKPVLCLTKISASGFTLIIVSLHGPEGTYEKLEDPDALAAVQEREARANANAKEYLRHKQSEATRRSPLAGARLLEIKKRYREAAEIYSEFLLENSDTDVYDALSRCYLALGDVASVVSTLEEYLEVTNRLDETLDKTLLERLEHSYNTVNTSS
jgi:tetratricopeptide (TPR) repeat protein